MGDGRGIMGSSKRIVEVGVSGLEVVVLGSMSLSRLLLDAHND